MSSPVVTVKEEMDTKKKTKSKIGVGSVVNDEVREMENTTREGRSRRMRKEAVGFVQSVLGKKKFFFGLKMIRKIDKFFFTCVFKFERGG